MIEEEVKDLIRQHMLGRIKTNETPQHVSYMFIERALTAVMAIAYNDGDTQAAAEDIIDIPTQQFGSSTEEIKKVFDVVAEKFPSEINAFATYVQDRESADDDILRKVESILK